MIAPTLIIGLGGTGSEIVSKIEEEYRNSNERIGYAIFDTDANELRTIKNGGFTGALIQTSENLTVGEYLNSDREAGDKWFPVHRTLNRKTLTEGAGQVRAISRLAFEAMLRAGGMEPLHNVIDNLYRLNTDTMKQSLRIVVVSSLAGGTGSGLVLPIGLYLRNYLIETYQQYSSIIRGFFIMPEIFNLVSKSPSERSSIQANTYAALRELNAFLMRGDGSLEPRFAKTIRFEVPKPGSSEKMNLDTMPYDYCFLFDKRSCSNEILSSFEEYKRLAKESVISLALEETSRRINSSEDNIIKELCREIGQGGCNRYCGMGTSKLVYPYEDIITYMADVWALDSLDSEWLKYDRTFDQMRQEEQRTIRMGGSIKKTTREDAFTHAIEVDRKDMLSTIVLQQCSTDSGEKIWDRYMQKLMDYVREYTFSNESTVGVCKENLESILSEIDRIKNIKAAGVELLGAMREYLQEAQAFPRDHVQELNIALFYTSKSDEEYYLKYWMKSISEERFIHPVTMRYFLYKLYGVLQKRIVDANQQIEDANKYLLSEEFEKLDNPKTRDREESREEGTSQLSEKESLLGEGERERQKDRLKEKYTNDLTNITKRLENEMIKAVLEKGCEFVEQLTSQFEQFFANLESLIGKIQDEKNMLDERYNCSEGRTVRYVGMTQKCRAAYQKLLGGKNGASSVDAELCNTILDAVTSFTVDTVLSGEVSISGFYRKIASDMRAYWKQAIRERYDMQINLNVLQAVWKEAEYELVDVNREMENEFCFSDDLIKEGEDEQEQYRRYVISTLEAMWKLSIPFISKPIGEEPRTIMANVFHKSVEYDTRLREIIDKYLKERGGTASDTTDRYTILFVQTIYGLSLTDFGKFSSNREGKYTPDKPQEGSAFGAYYEMVNHIHPNYSRTTCLSPHLDRNWHYINVMPEIDRNEQRRIEKEICKAMIYGLVLNYITNRRTTKYAGHFKYLLNFAEEELICNDDICDTFAEVLTSLIKNHMIVERILEEANKDICKTITAAKNLNTSYLYKCLDSFQILEIDRLITSKMVEDGAVEKKIGNMEAESEDSSEKALREVVEEKAINPHSILEIGLIYSQTAPKEEYDEVFAVTLIQAAFDVLEETVRLYLINSDDVRYCLTDIIIKQYKLYYTNLKKMEIIWPNLHLEPMAEQTKLLTGQKLRELGCLEEAEFILGTLSKEQHEELLKKKANEEKIKEMMYQAETEADFRKASLAVVESITKK